MRVRVPLEKHSTADEHQLKIMKLYKKFNSEHNKHHNEVHDANDEVEARENSESREEELSDHEILGAAKPSHPCSKEVLVEKQACGMKNKRCEYEVYGIPRKKIVDLKLVSN